MLGEQWRKRSHATSSLIVALPPWMTVLALCTSFALIVDALPQVNNCTFPAEWRGKWFLSAKPVPGIINETHFIDKKCILREKDMYLTSEHYTSNGSICHRCLIINMRHGNVITYRETSYCAEERKSLDETCTSITTDDNLISMFRFNPKPIPCPFNGPTFSFSYNRGHGECNATGNQAETCADDSKILLKSQACPDVKGTESSTEELQCLATWKDGSNFFMVGFISFTDRTRVDQTFGCFLYEKLPHHDDKVVYRIAQSGDSSCSGMTSVNEGARLFTFLREEKERVRCKYPTWVTQHHVWHSLDGKKSYHFTTGNSTLKISYKAEDTKSDIREDKVICHNLEQMYPNDDMKGSKVKLVAHVTSGCDTGYVCMIFHKRDANVIEVQQSSQKAVIPNEACDFSDPSKEPFSTLITFTLHKRSCPQPGRYSVLDLIPARVKNGKRDRRKASRLSQSTSSDEIQHSRDCQNSGVQIGCTTSGGQNEMIVAENCNRHKIVYEYSCHGSWEEKGTWYTIVSRNQTHKEKETLCVSMKLTKSTQELPNRAGRVEQQVLWLSAPQTYCQRGLADVEWNYRLVNQGVCEDLMRAASSSGSNSVIIQIPCALYIVFIFLRTFLWR